MLKIGLSACFMYPDPNRVVFGPKTLLYMGLDMSYYLGMKGVMPILIPELPSDQQFYQFLDQLDGILLQGGTDINPFLYNEKAKYPESEGDLHRDMYETRIVEYALKNNKPILGICRGMQLLNVYFGGSLYQDLPRDNKDLDKHMDHKLYDEHVHDIEFTKGGLLEKLYKDEKLRLVNSVHHQGIHKLGKNLKVEAINPSDQLIEAIMWTGDEKLPGDNLVLGIQWHPEFSHTMMTETIDHHPIIEYFIDYCQEKSKASLT